MLTTCTHSDYCLARWLADEGDEVVGVASRGWLMHLAVLERTSPRRGIYVVRYACTRVLSPESLVLAACRHSDVSPPLTLWSNSYIFSSLSPSLAVCNEMPTARSRQPAQRSVRAGERGRGWDVWGSKCLRPFTLHVFLINCMPESSRRASNSPGNEQLTPLLPASSYISLPPSGFIFSIP